MCHALEFTDKLARGRCASAWISFFAVTLRFDMGISENNEKVLICTYEALAQWLITLLYVLF